jgi:hypothetical protein
MRLDAILSESFGIAENFGPEWRELPGVGSGGCTESPRMALVFINPTARNQSARNGWAGERAPFIGLSRIWKFLSSTGLISQKVVDGLPKDGQWTEADATRFYAGIADEGIYVTNLVKACRMDATLPSTKMARSYVEHLKYELSLVGPSVVVGMGGLVSSLLAGESVSIGALYESFRNTGTVKQMPIGGMTASLAPCYFPVGRGNPVRAREILQALNDETRKCDRVSPS